MADYLKGMSLAGKAKCIADMFSGKIKVVVIPSTSVEIKSKLTNPLVNHIGESVEYFDECQQLTIEKTVFTFGNSFIFHRSRMGDAHIINIWKDEKNIFTIGGLIEAHNMQIYYDHLDNIIYVIYFSEQENKSDDINEVKTYVSVLTIEDPIGNAICNDFKWLIEI